jgi:hypothetical protein
VLQKGCFLDDDDYDIDDDDEEAHEGDFTQVFLEGLLSS